MLIYISLSLFLYALNLSKDGEKNSKKKATDETPVANHANTLYFLQILLLLKIT